MKVDVCGIYSAMMVSEVSVSAPCLLNVNKIFIHVIKRE